jgi:DnaJ-class molecular chaperone
VLENKELKTVRKLGMPFYKDPMSYGNLHLEFKVVFPPSGFLSSLQAKLLR